MNGTRMILGTGRRPHFRHMLFLLVIASLFSGSGLAQARQRPPLPPVSAACPRVVVPAYAEPSVAEWDRIIAAAPLVEYVIFAPNIGPGEEPLEDYQRVVREAQAAGIKVLGYIYTDLAERDLEELKAEVRTYEDWYAVDGIHIDGAQDEPQYIPYFRELAETIREAGPDGRDGVVWLNPGYAPDEGYMEFVDIVEVYEWFYRKYAGQTFPEWINRYPAERFAHIVYNTPNSKTALVEVLIQAERRNAGYVYVTDLLDPLHYQALPTFWDETLDYLCS